MVEDDSDGSNNTTTTLRYQTFCKTRDTDVAVKDVYHPRDFGMGRISKRLLSKRVVMI